MERKIVQIDEDKCTGCGACAVACHEGAIGMIDGKAKLLRDDYCDGFGDCLPDCPADAIHITVREALPYDEEAVQAHMRDKAQAAGTPIPCPTGSGISFASAPANAPAPGTSAAPFAATPVVAEPLRNWPVQMQLCPVKSPYFNGADLLIAADCTAYAYAGFHTEFAAGKVVLIGCTKLDSMDYKAKLREIIAQNDIRSLTVLRMEVPCCGGMSYAATNALAESGKDLPCRVVILSTDGQILDDSRN